MSVLENSALIGYSGFVGSTLMKQTTFHHLYRSTNITEIRNKSFDLAVCAGAPAQKWIANKDPQADLDKILALIENLKTIQSDFFILISTVDVFSNPIGVHEETPISENGLSPYGLNRRLLENFVQERFKQHLIVRLPGLVGPGLRKNIIFDFLHHNNLNAIDSRGIFQFYPMVNLWPDIETARLAGLNAVHLTAEPISVADVARLAFSKNFENLSTGTPAKYDMQTLHGRFFSGSGNYQYSKRETILAIRSFCQSEQKRDPSTELKS